jgi:uncharacterized protein with PIN domain
MGKFSRDLDESLEKKVKTLAREMHITDWGINVEAIRLKKSKKEVGTVLKANDLVTLFTGDESLVAVALYEEALNRMDSQNQDLVIRSLLSQISYDADKDKIVITKPELQISLGMYRQFGDIAVKSAELQLLTLAQIADEEKEKKANAKKKKKN